MGHFSEFVPGSESRSEVLAIEESAQQMPFQREVLPDRTEAMYIALFSNFIPCGVHEAVYILDGGRQPIPVRRA